MDRAKNLLIAFGLVSLIIGIMFTTVLAVNSDWPNSPLAMPSDGWVQWLFEGVSPAHNGIDIWTNTAGTGNSDRFGNPCTEANTNPCSKGNRVYLPHSGKLISKSIDDDFALSGLIFEHQIDPTYSPFLPKDSQTNNPILHIWTFYWHMADDVSGTSYVNSDLQVGREYDAGTFLGNQGNRRQKGDPIVHLHLSISKSSSESGVIDPSPYLGPDFSPPRTIDNPYWVNYNGPPLELGGVFIFNDARYNGSWLRFDQSGLYNIPSWLNDRVSSIKIPFGWSVRLYKNENRNGNVNERRQLEQNLADFGTNTFDDGTTLNDSVSAIEIFINQCPAGAASVFTPDGTLQQCVPPSTITPSPNLTPIPPITPSPIPSNGIKLCTDSNAGGTCRVFLEGGWQDLSNYGLDRNVSWVGFIGSYIGNYTVIFADDVNGAGQSGRFDADINLTDWNNRARSLRVERHGTPRPPINCDDPPLGVTLYELPDYKGDCQNFTSHAMHLGNEHIGDNRVSSIRIRGDYVARLYQEPDWKGCMQEYRGDDINFSDNPCGDNQASSLQVFKSGDLCAALGEGITLFVDRDFRGHYQTFTQNVNFLGNTSLGDNTASSYVICGNWRGKLYRDPDRKGQSQDLEGTGTWISALDDQGSSLEVWQFTPPPTPTFTPSPTPTPVPTAPSNNLGNLVVSIVASESTDGQVHGETNPYIIPLNAHFANVWIKSGAYASSQVWTGSYGGIVRFSATGEVRIDGILTVTGKGYRGGPPVDSGSGYQGESHTGLGQRIYNQPNAGGGGGGRDADRGGGGGGYGSPGEPSHQGNGDTNNAAVGGQPYGDAVLTTLYLGSGGGSSGAVSAGARGGNGGGIIDIVADQIIVNGAITANGEDGGSACQHNCAESNWRGGGGGSGGSIKLVARVLQLGNNRVTALGGNGGYGINSGGDISGGYGGNGRIHIQYSESLNGETMPSAFVVTPTPLPDLTVNSMSAYQEGTPDCREQPYSLPFVMRAEVANIGDTPAGSFTVNINNVQQLEVAGLTVGEVRVLTFATGFGGGLNTVTIDAGSHVQEANEQNNSLTQDIFIPTMTPIATCTPTPTDTSTPTSTNTPTPSDTPTPTATTTATITPTFTPTATDTPTTTNTPTASATSTSTSTPTFTATATDTPTPTSTNTPTPTNTATSTPSYTPTPTSTPTLTPTPTPTPLTGNIADNAHRDRPGSDAVVDGSLNTQWIGGHKTSIGFSWSESVNIHKVIVWDRNQDDADNNQINKIRIDFSDSTYITDIDMTSGGPRCAEVSFSEKQVTWVNIIPYDASGNNGYREVEIYATTGEQSTNNSCPMTKSGTPGSGGVTPPVE